MFLQGIWEPINFECDINDPIVVGNIPKELNGTFYRNGPNPQYVYSASYHMFEGDGMIHAVTFINGEVKYQNRWIRTDRFLAERNARKSLFGGMRDFMARDESVQNTSHNTANTNVIWHHNQLLALNEGGQPVNLDKNDLTHCSIYTFNHTFDRSMMAHPKIDPQSGELIFYSYFGPNFMYYIADNHGQITHQENLQLPYQCLMHDFAITENFTIIPLFPLTWDYQRLMRGEAIFKWEPNLNTRFAILPRNGKNQDVIWFECEAMLGMHTVNAREVNGKIILEMIGMNDIPIDAIAFGDDRIIYTNSLIRWTFDLSAKTIIKEKMDDMNVEFPRIDERFTGRIYKHAFMNGTVNKNLPHCFFDSVIHYDMQRDEKRLHYFGEDALAVEPIFVPRSNHAKEGDGFVLCYVYRKSLNRSDLIILDSKRIEDEPVATIQLPHRVPFGFHGCWVDENA